MGAKRKRQLADSSLTAIITRKLFWFGQQMRSFRVERGLDQAEFGRLIGLGDKSIAAISRFENGKRGLSFHSMVLMARTLGYDLEIKFTPIRKVENGSAPVAKVATGKEVTTTVVSAPVVKKEKQQSAVVMQDIPSND